MAVIKQDCMEADLSNDVDNTVMMESPLKLVEQTVNAVSMRQRTGSSALSRGMHFKAPSKAAYACGNVATFDGDGGALVMQGKRVVAKTSPLQTGSTTSESGMVSTEGNSSTAGISKVDKEKSMQQQQQQLLLNNSNGGSPKVSRGSASSCGATVTSSCTVGSGDDSQHSSTSEYGSMADTHSTMSDSRLSSPILARSVSKTALEWQSRRNQNDQSATAENRASSHYHAKSPSWPDMYFNAAMSSTRNLVNTSTPVHLRTKSCWNSSSSCNDSQSSSLSEGANSVGTPFARFTPTTDDFASQSSFLSSAVTERYPRAYEPADSEHPDSSGGGGGGDTSTLRRCSAQSMREICPKLLKKLQQQPQSQQQQQQPMQQHYWRTSMRTDINDKGHTERCHYATPHDAAGILSSLDGNLASNSATGKEENDRILPPPSLMHSKSSSQIWTSGSAAVTPNKADGASSTPKMMDGDTGYGRKDRYSYLSSGGGGGGAANRSLCEIYRESNVRHEESGEVENFSSVQRAASSENVHDGQREVVVENGLTTACQTYECSPYYHSSSIVRMMDSSSVRDSRTGISSYNQIRHIDDEDDEDDDVSFRASTKTNASETTRQTQKISGSIRVRYQQRHQAKGAAPTQISIRRKRQQAMAEMAQARSMPDLSADQESSRNAVGSASKLTYDEESTSSASVTQRPRAKHTDVDEPLAYATSHRLTSLSFSATTPPLYAVPQKLNNVERGNQQFMTTKASPPPPPLPRKPPPPPPPPTTAACETTRNGHHQQIYHCRRASDSGLVQASTLDERQNPPEQTGNSVAMISRKLFADQIRAHSLSGANHSTAANSSSSNGQKIASSPSTVHYPSATNSTANHQVRTTTFPVNGPNVNRRVVQVHPMCMNSSAADHQDVTSTTNQAQNSSASSSSSAQYCQPDTGFSTSSSMQTNADARSTPTPANKPRPPVPKKPAKLVISSSTSRVHGQYVPVRPPKPQPLNLNGENENGRLDGLTTVDGDGSSFMNCAQRENGLTTAGMLPLTSSSSTVSGTNGASPFKQRKQLEDEERCRELSNYVAQKSNDSSLKQILAPNQRSSVDYLEECFANGKLSSTFGDGDYCEGNSAKDMIQKIIFNSTNANGQNGFGRALTQPIRMFSSESVDLEKEKIDLIARMSRKLKVLKEEQRAVEEEIRCNNELGVSLVTVIDDSTALTKSAKDRFRQFMVDMENITQLLLKLSVQLARMDTEINRLTHGGHLHETLTKEKRHQLMDRRQRLVTQLHDAKELREDLDRRGEQILTILTSVLTPEQLADYQYFIQMKYKLLLDAREIDDKIKLGEDQKSALEQSLSKT